MTRPTNFKAWSNLIFRTVAIALGIAVVVLQTLHSAPAETAITLLGLGLFSLALSSLPAKEA
jgi:energy-converting hydrogenase Eha subunit A